MKQQATLVTVSGSHGEGGGALFRTALACSCLTQTPVRINNIRGAMRTKGLTSEDLTYLGILAASTGAVAEGDDLGSSHMSFAPRHLPRRVVGMFDCGAHEKGIVSSSAMAVLQAVVPVLARSGGVSQVSVTGETHTPNMLGYDAFERVTVPAHRAQGIHTWPALVKSCFSGGSPGEVLLEIEPSVIEAVSWERRGRLVKCGATISIAELRQEIAVRGTEALNGLFRDRGMSGDIEVATVPSTGPGVAVTVWAEYENGFGSGSSTGQRGVPIHTVCENAFRSFALWADTDATCDSFLADQMLLTGAMAEGRSSWTTPNVTRRLVTMSWVIKQFMPIQITVLGQEGQPGRVKIER